MIAGHAPDLADVLTHARQGALPFCAWTARSSRPTGSPPAERGYHLPAAVGGSGPAHGR